MDYELHEKVVSKIPGVVNKIIAWNSYGEVDDDCQQISETVTEYTASGNVIGKTHFTIDHNELVNHIKRAKKMGLEVSVSDTLITVKRNLASGGCYFVEYKAISA